MRKNYLLIICILVTVLSLFALSDCSRDSAIEDAENQSIAQLTPWIAYWDYTGISNLNEDQGVSLFGIVYDESGNEVILPQFEEMLQKLDENHKGKKYLTFVNDVCNEDGSVTAKSVEFLEKVFVDEEAQDKVADDMVKRTKKLGFDAIDLDFEGIHKGENLWDGFVNFVEKVYEKAKSENIGLRVVLESSTPVEEIELPKGPEYTVMCYNLYGYHSDAGPKADLNFVREMAKKFSCLEKIGASFATGGFDWNSKGKVERSLTFGQVKELVMEKEAIPTRDEDSKALYFTYEGEDGTHTVWFADSETIGAWIKEFRLNTSENAPISIWRVEGGNAEFINEISEVIAGEGKI